MSGWVPPRRGEEAVEWMDAGRGTVGEIAEAYEQLAEVNRRLAGFRSTLEALEGLLPGIDPVPEGKRATFTILDVAGGAGDFAAELAAWSRTLGREPVAWLLDRNALALLAARHLGEEALVPVRADALALPFGNRSFDLVHCATFFHHLSTARARDVLAEMCRVSRRLVAVNDLVRSYVAAGAIWALSRALSSNRLIRHDGPLSVLKAFVPGELAALARGVGGEALGFRWRLTRTFPYRMTLVGARFDPGTGPDE